MLCRQHGYPWPSLATSPYYSSPLAGLQGYILCPHIAAVCKFELVILLLPYVAIIIQHYSEIFTKVNPFKCSDKSNFQFKLQLNIFVYLKEKKYPTCDIMA